MPARRQASTSSLDAYAKLTKRQWKGTTTDGSACKNFIAGKFSESKATTHYDVHDPVSHVVWPVQVWDCQKERGIGIAISGGSSTDIPGDTAGHHPSASDYTRGDEAGHRDVCRGMEDMEEDQLVLPTEHHAQVGLHSPRPICVKPIAD